MKFLINVVALAAVVSAVAADCPNCLDSCLNLGPPGSDERMLYLLVSKIRGAKIANDVESKDSIQMKPRALQKVKPAGL